LGGTSTPQNLSAVAQRSHKRRKRLAQLAYLPFSLDAMPMSATVPPPIPQAPDDALLPLLRARAPLIVIETHEELAVLERVRRLLPWLLKPLHSWSITQGLKRLDIAGEPSLAMSSNEVLDAIDATPQPAIFVLFEFEPYLAYAVSQRKFREIVLRHRNTEHTLVLVSPKNELPANIQSLAQMVPMPLPTPAELLHMIRQEASEFAKQQAGRKVQLYAQSVNTIVRLLSGVKLEDARRIARKIIAHDGKVSEDDIPDVIRSKFQLLEKEGVLHYEADTIHLDEIAGLERLKQWVQLRKRVFTGEQDAGLDPPKGVLLLGVQGCGKSMAAKAIARGFGAPLLRLDMAAIYDKYHGESERKLRDSLAHAGNMAPCVLWIDEIEKGMATSQSDDGVSRRILGSFLTWMSERKTPVFVVATANQIEQLPAELLRKGRFDEIFFVDLPRGKVREQAFQIHLKRRKLAPDDFDTLALAQASLGFSGAEIEQAIISAQYTALANSMPLHTDDIMAEVKRTRPLSVVMAEAVARLRAWAAERTVPADQVPDLE
jgi:ATP-dependent 26S proteasome regulatory subunit